MSCVSPYLIPMNRFNSLHDQHKENYAYMLYCHSYIKYTVGGFCIIHKAPTTLDSWILLDICTVSKHIQTIYSATHSYSSESLVFSRDVHQFQNSDSGSRFGILSYLKATSGKASILSLTLRKTRFSTDPGSRHGPKQCGLTMSPT